LVVNLVVKNQARQYPCGVSQAEHDRTVEVAVALPLEERAWLDEQLDTYRELLDYLHDH
jgi:hypothetical protein